MQEPILMCWSGGKDSAMALHDVLTVARRRVAALLTTVTEGFDRISMHGVRRELLERQAAAIGLPLHQVTIPPQCVNPVYEARMEEALRIHLAGGIREVAFGDIFLEDLPPGADPCGENGEFHSFVFDGPLFKQPVHFVLGEKVQRDSFCFCDLLPSH